MQFVAMVDLDRESRRKKNKPKECARSKFLRRINAQLEWADIANENLFSMEICK